MNAIANATHPPPYPVTISKNLALFLDSCFKIKPKERANVYELLHHPFIIGK